MMVGNRLLRNAVAMNLLIAVLAVSLQISVISWVSHTQPDLVAAIGLVELIFSWIVAISFFGGEQYFQNFSNKNPNIPIDKILYATFGLVLVVFFIFCIIATSLIYFFPNYLHSKLQISVFELSIIVSAAFFAVLICLLAARFRTLLNVTMAALCEKSYIIIFSTLLVVVLTIISNSDNEEVSSNSVYFVALIASFFSFMIWAILMRRETNNALSPKRQDSIGPSSYKTLSIMKLYFTREGGFFYLTALVVLIFERIDQIVLVTTIGIAELGGYYACYKLSFAVRFIAKTINSAMYPYLSKYANSADGNSLNELFKINRLINFSIALVFTLILYVFSEQLLLLLFGSAFLKYQIVLEIMAVALLFSTLNQVDFNYLNATGKSNLFFINSILTVCVQLIFIIIFYSTLGISALVLSRLFAVITGYLFARWHLREFNHSIIPTLICFSFVIVILKDFL